MRPRLHIRLAKQEDARAIGVLVRRGTRQDILRDQSAKAGAYLMATMTARAERDRMCAGHRYHLAELGDILVGVVATRNDKHVFRLFVSPRYQRCGIARALLRRAVADCRKRSGTTELTLFASKCAVPAYVRLGFVPSGKARARGAGGVVAAPMTYRPGRVAAADGGKSRSRPARA